MSKNGIYEFCRRIGFTISPILLLDYYYIKKHILWEDYGRSANSEN